MIYKTVPLTDGQPMQYLAKYITKWKAEDGQPDIGLVDAEVPVNEIVRLMRLIDDWANTLENYLAIDWNNGEDFVEYTVVKEWLDSISEE